MATILDMEFCKAFYGNKIQTSLDHVVNNPMEGKSTLVYVKAMIFKCVWLTKLSRRQHDDVMTWNRFPHYWPCVRGIHRSNVYSPHKGSVRMFTLISSWTSCRTNRQEADEWRCPGAHRRHCNKWSNPGGMSGCRWSDVPSTLSVASLWWKC